MEFLRTPVVEQGAGAAASTPTGNDSRTDIRSSFHALFPSATPGPGPDHGFSYPSLTPFLGAVTPAVPHGIPRNFGSAHGTGTPGLPPFHASPHAPSPDMVQLTSPFLQAAAKEAVRREFMSMPAYAAASSSSPSEPERQSSEQTVPGNDHAKTSKPTPPASSSAQTVPSYPYPPYNGGMGQYPGMFFMPYPGMSQPGQKGAEKTGRTGEDDRAEPEPEQAKSTVAQQQQAQQQQAQQQQAHQQQAHQQQLQQQQQQQQMAAAAAAMGGMMVMGPVGPMIVPSPYGYPGAQAMVHPHMMMMPPHAGGVPPSAFGAPGIGSRAPAVHKNETQAEKKIRIEAEKQDLIREFKKKTREAALVRFRQKRRERRFGKLIRYDCRKVLAEKRPRVKGRFVRVKEGEEDGDADSELHDAKQTESSLSVGSNEVEMRERHRRGVCSPDSMSQVVPDGPSS